jgi:hypothetical protein
MLGRVITIDTGYQTVTAAQDLLEVKLGSGQAGYVLRAKVMQSSDESAAEAEVLQVNLKKATGAYTSGSSGTSPATIVLCSNTLANGFALTERNNTSQASAGSGTLEVMEPGIFNVLSGEWEFCPTPEMMEKGKLGPSEAAVLSLDEAPADALTLRAIIDLLITHG